jgi:hypothetical protein
MSQTATRDERRSALDEFAATSRQQVTETLPAIATKAPPPMLVHGPQPVARYRDESQILIKLKTLAAAAGDDWFYRIPFKDRKTGRTTYAEGPSIKLANDLGRIYGACDVDSWVSAEGIDFWEITARFIDLESGFSLTRPFRQRKNVSRIGGSDDARRDETGFSIGVSKAERNVVVNALQTFADFAFEEARNALVDKIGRDVDGWRRKIIERLSGMVALERVEAVIGRAAQDWLAPDIARVAAMGKAIKDGMATLDETFPVTTAVGTKSDLDAFAAAPIFADSSAGVSGSPSAAAEQTGEEVDAQADAAWAETKDRKVQGGGGDEGLQQASVPADSSSAGSPAVSPHLSGVGSGEPTGPSGTPSSLPPGAARKALIESAMQLATRPGFETDARLDMLDELRAEAGRLSGLSADDIKDVVTTAAKVARSEITKKMAEKYLSQSAG